MTTIWLLLALGAGGRLVLVETFATEEQCVAEIRRPADQRVCLPALGYPPKGRR